MSNPLCNDCKASGLPLLPVRYVPVPNSVSQALPGWASGARVKDVALGAEFHYALRTLRGGYVYLFYSKNAKGSKVWECYMVTEDGLLIKQPDPLMAPPVPQPSLTCTRQGHSNVRLQHLVIEHPEMCGTTWIAFSESKWSKETLKEYTDNDKLRDSRMQTIQPPAMAGGAKHSHGTTASEAALEDVIEYAANFSTASLPHQSTVTPFSKDDGSYDAGRLGRVSTMFAWHQRQGQAAETVKFMKERAKRGDGTSNTPVLLSLWDAVGTARELNGYRNDAAGWLKLYGEERSLQLSAANTLAGLRKALTDLAGDKQKQAQDQQQAMAGNWHDPQEAAQRRARAQSLPEPQRTHQLEICDIVDDWARRRVPITLGYQGRLNAANQLAEPKRSQEIARVKADVEQFISRRSNNANENIQHARAEAWPKYQERVDQASLNLFNKHWDRLQQVGDEVVDKRTEALVRWLEAPLFIDTLEDFNQTNINDGVLFDDLVGTVMFGIGSTPSGAKKLDEWVKQADASVKQNLAWRCLALNQKEGLAALSLALKEAEKHRTDQTLATSITWTGYTAKVLKGFADVYKKAQGVYDANEKANSAAGSKVFKAQINSINMRGADKFVISFGDRAFRHFSIDKLGDYASEKVIQHLFSIRAFVSPLDSELLVQTQATEGKVGQEQLLRRLRATNAFMRMDSPELRAEQTQALKDAWEKFRHSGDAKVGQAIKDARLALVVALIEGVNFSKLVADCKMKGDAKSYFSLLASSMTITSALFDVGATVVKNLPAAASERLPGLGGESWTYQVLKGWGGLLSGAASFIGGVLDFVDAGKAREKGYSALRMLYLLKASSSVVAGLLTLAVTFTYASPLVKRLAGQALGRAVTGAAINAAGKAAAAVIGFRILGMAVGGWITVGTLGIQVIIWIITPNALQDWVDHCAFGMRRKTGGYANAKEQEEKLGQVLVEMGLQ